MKKRAEDEAATPNAQLKRRFGYLTNALTNSGVLAGTAHKRILIPKDKLTEQDLHTLGFVPVLAAIPEAGQDKFTSYRHPEHNFHVHSHPEGWTMHEDEHPSATMLARKATGAVNKAKAFIGGAPHVSEEGLPGLYYYVKGRLGGHASTAQRVMNELGPDTWKRISRLRPSATYAEKEASAMRDALKQMVSSPQQKKLLAYSLGTGVGSILLNNLANSAMDRSVAKSLKIPEDRALTDKLIGASRFPVHHSKNFDNAMAVLPEASPEDRDDIKKVLELAEDLKPGVTNLVLGHEHAVPGMVAHEMGHGNFHEGAIGRFLHLRGPDISNLSAALGVGAGFVAGAGTGGKYNKALSLASVGLPVAGKLVSDLPEIAASYKAMGILREQGATEEQLSRARKQLLRAYGSYASGIPGHASLGLLGQYVGTLTKSAGAMRAELEKLALLERLVRLGATDIPKTPRLLMKQRSPGELAGLQRGVEQWWGKNISAPVQRVADKGLNRLPEGKLKNVATQGAKLVAQDPIGTLAVNAIPVPGALPAYLGAKRGLERVIDRVAPMAST